MKIISVFIVTLTISFSVPGQIIQDTFLVDHYQTKNFDCAIFPSNYSTIHPPDKLSKRYFTPSRQEIDSAENALVMQLDKQDSHYSKHDLPLICKKLNEFRRQYFGYIDSTGHKILFINSFWAPQEKRKKSRDSASSNHLKIWLQKKISVDDGGASYWNIKFDTASKILFALKINGPG